MVKIDKIWLDDKAVWIRTADGTEACEYFADYPRLKHATDAQRANYTIDAVGIHWAEIDEDLSFEGFFDKKPNNPIYQLFMAYAELNVAAIARRMGIAQSLLAQYISGIKTPGAQRTAQIKETLRAIGRELASIS